MTATEYRAAIAALGMSQAAASRFFGVHAITAHRWTTTGPPTPVAMLLKLMVELRFTPEYVERVIRPDRPNAAAPA